MADDKKSEVVDRAQPIDDLVTTRHTLATEAGELAYAATTGRIVLREEVHKDDAFEGYTPKAEVFLTAYLLDGADPLTRPLTFAFNGGPGSSSVWLHMGLLGPRRVQSGDAGALRPPPYGLLDNRSPCLPTPTWSSSTRCPPDTRAPRRARSRPTTTGTARTWSRSARFIRLWTSRTGRWMSPKYLCGESYGTLRAAALCRHLQERRGMNLNGLILISSVLDMATLEFGPDNDAPYPLYLPTYAAIAHYHGLHGDRPLAEVLAEAEGFASREYPWALARGARLSTEDRTSTVATLARLAGLDPDYVDRVNLRVEHVRFFTEMLRSRRRTVGRLDGRFLGWDADAGQEHWSADPSYDAILGPYTAAVNHYLRVELKLRQRPALRDPHRPGHAVVLPGLREPLCRGGRQAGGRDARQPFPARLRGLRVPRRCHAVLRRGAHHGAPRGTGRTAGQHLLRVLRGRTHDVCPRAEPARAVGPARRVRARRGLKARARRVIRPDGRTACDAGPGQPQPARA